MCKRDELFEYGLRDGYFRSLSYRLCLLMTMHCEWYWITCTAQLYYSHVSASVIATRWILTKSPRCDGLNLCRGVVLSEPGGVDQYSSYCSVFQASSFKLKAVFGYTTEVSNTSRSLLYAVELSYFITWNLTLYNLIEETVYCFCGNKTVHDCCCFELFYRLELDFLGLLERYVIICFCFFM